MSIDLRYHQGKGPKCEFGLCRNRSLISVGDAAYRSGIGRMNICKEHAEALKTLLGDADLTGTLPTPPPPKNNLVIQDPGDQRPPEPDPEEEEAAPAEGEAVEDVSRETIGEYDTLKRPELLKLAKARGLKVSATTTTAEIITQLENQDAQS